MDGEMEAGSGDGEMDYSSPPYDQWDFAQPYMQWDHARRYCPVIEEPGFSFTAEPALPRFTITSWDDADEVLRDWRTFSSSVNAEIMGPYMGELMLGLDGDEHRRYRNLVAHAFRRSTLERWRSELVEPVIQQLLDGIAPAGRAELVGQVTSKFPVQVICVIVGVPAEDHEQFNQWAMRINYGPLYPEEGRAASRAMRDYLEPLVEGRRAEPTGDLLSELVHAEIDGVRLTDEKIYGFLRLLLPAGAETTYRAFGSCLLALLERPEVMARVRADRSLVRAAVEETLRWETSVTMVARRAGRGHRDRRLRGARGRERVGDQRVGVARRGPLGRSRPLGSRPGAPGPHGLRHRTAPVPGDASGSHGAGGGDQRRARPPAQPAARPRRRATGHQRLRLPGPSEPAGPLRPA